jgi:hypothetical protein
MQKVEGTVEMEDRGRLCGLTLGRLDTRKALETLDFRLKNT